MKTVLVCLASLFILFSCKKDDLSSASAKGPFTVGLDLQAIFKNDSVKIIWDGREVYNNLTTSNEATGFADAVRLSNQSKGHHTLLILVNGSLSTSRDYEVLRDQYYGITLDGIGKLSVDVSEVPYLYL